MIITVISVLLGGILRSWRFGSGNSPQLENSTILRKERGVGGTLGNGRLIRVRINLKAGFNHILPPRSYPIESSLVRISFHWTCPHILDFPWHGTINIIRFIILS